MTKIYVAGASAEIERVEAFIREVRARFPHVVIAHDWTRDIRERAARGLSDADLTLEERRHFVDLVATAIAASEVAVFLIPRPGASTTGLWAELGLARAECVRTVAVADDAAQMRYLFAHLARDIVPDDDAAIAWLATYLGYHDQELDEPIEQLTAAAEALRVAAGELAFEAQRMPEVSPRTREWLDDVHREARNLAHIVVRRGRGMRPLRFHPSASWTAGLSRGQPVDIEVTPDDWRPGIVTNVQPDRVAVGHGESTYVITDSARLKR